MQLQYTDANITLGVTESQQGAMNNFMQELRPQIYTLRLTTVDILCITLILQKKKCDKAS